MNKTDFTNFIKMAQKVVSKRSPEILTGIGIVGMVTTTILAVRATPKALKLIEEAENEKQEKNKEKTRKLTPVETVKVAWKSYVPSAITGILSIGCIIGANSVNVRRQAALYSAYKLSETAFSEYKEKVAETVNEKKIKEIKQKIAEDKIEEATNNDSKVKVVVSNDGDTWFIDPFSNIQFKSTLAKIDSAINEINRRMLIEMSVSLSDFYDELGINREDRSNASENVGWHIDDGFVTKDCTDAIVKDGKAYVVLDFLVAPTYGYDDKNRLYG